MFEISIFDYGISILAIVLATGFYLLRRGLRVPNAPEQWLSDVFNVGTLVILLDLFLLPLTRRPAVLPAPWGEAMRGAAAANGIVVLAAIGNCIRVIGAGLIRSFTAGAIPA